MTAKSAIISECGRYRYYLTRSWNEVGVSEKAAQTPLFIGVNPSTADADVDDATVRKWTGFCARWGHTRFAVVNLFAYRSPDVKHLEQARDPIGKENDWYFAQAINKHDLIIPCWGSRGKIPKQLHYRIDIVNVLLQGKNVKCFGKTTSGDPMLSLIHI